MDPPAVFFFSFFFFFSEDIRTSHSVDLWCPRKLKIHENASLEALKNRGFEYLDHAQVGLEPGQVAP